MPTWEPVRATLKIANIGEVEIAPNYDTIRIAYQAWIEIQTRKVGLPFDDQHDLLVEVYDSWYEVFGILRDLAKSVPASRLREYQDTRHLVEYLMRVLNDGLRPHLTRWQARFRHWYHTASHLDANKNKAPQDLQKEFPEYQKLVTDLKQVNNDFIEYAEWLRRLAEGPDVRVSVHGGLELEQRED